MVKINWKDHLINLVVVILGISVAFYLESYRQSSSERKQELQYLESLIKDLETDISALDTIIAFNENVSSALVDLSEASIGVKSLSDSLMIAHIFSIQYNPSFTPQRTTYETLKASGRIDYIHDFELRNQIVELYEQYYRGAHEYNVTVYEHVRDFVKPFYMKSIRFNTATDLDDGFLIMDEFKNMIFSYRYLANSKNEFNDMVLEHTKSLVDKIREYKDQLK